MYVCIYIYTEARTLPVLDEMSRCEKKKKLSVYNIIQYYVCIILYYICIIAVIQRKHYDIFIDV